MIDKIYTGTTFGQIIQLNPRKTKVNEQQKRIGIMKKEKITKVLPNHQSLFFSSQHIIYRKNLNQDHQQIVKIFDGQYENKKLIGFEVLGSGNSLLTAFQNGKIIYNSISQQGLPIKTQQIFTPKVPFEGGKKYYRKMMGQESEETDKLLFVGKGLLPFIFDIKKSATTWTGKNVQNDQLDLNVQINDVDAIFYNNRSNIACAHADSKIRLFDIRSNKRKPTHDFQLKLQKTYTKNYLTKLQINPQNQAVFYVANDMGGIYECDLRKNMLTVGKFKGINSTVTDMSIVGSQLISTSLDCYVRRFELESKTLVEKYYLNKPLHSLYVSQLPEENLQQYEQKVLSQIDSEQLRPEIEDKQSKKMKKLRKRNKIKLKYLKEVNWDEVPIDEELLKQQEEKYQQLNPKDAEDFLDSEDEENNQIKIKDQHLSDDQFDSDLE